jgi:polyisoprenoid-binding protein YceI
MRVCHTSMRPPSPGERHALIAPVDGLGAPVPLDEAPRAVVSADFLDVEHHPEIRFSGRVAQLVGPGEYKVGGELTVRGVRRPVVLDVRRTGEWSTPWWEDGVDRGPKLRAGFVATARIDRHDFGVSWNTPSRGAES